MFTGLIESMGVLLDRAMRGPGARLVVKMVFPDATERELRLDGELKLEAAK